MVYQPQVGVGDGRIRGFEALLRWQHPSVGDVPPGLFLPLLEEARLISRLGSWIYHRSAAQRKVWERLFADDLVLGVSLSSRSEEHTSELQSLMRISYAVFCLKKKQQS